MSPPATRPPSPIKLPRATPTTVLGRPARRPHREDPLRFREEDIARSVHRLVEALVLNNDPVGSILGYEKQDNAFARTVLARTIAQVPTWFQVCSKQLIGSRNRNFRWSKESDQKVELRVDQFQKLLNLLSTMDPDSVRQGSVASLALVEGDYYDTNQPLLRCWVAQGLNLHEPLKGLEGGSLFMRIAGSAHADNTLEWMLQHPGVRSKLDQIDRHGWNALDWASLCGSVNGALALIRAGANPYRVTPRRPDASGGGGGLCPAEMLVAMSDPPLALDMETRVGQAFALGSQQRLEESTPASSNAPAPKRSMRL